MVIESGKATTIDTNGIQQKPKLVQSKQYIKLQCEYFLTAELDRGNKNKKSLEITHH